MALKKTIIETNGISTEYHKIKSVTIGTKMTQKKCAEGSDKITEQAFYFVNAEVAAYVSEELRQKSAHNSVIDRTFNFRIPAEDVDTNGIHALVYAKLKEQKLFEDAEDC